MRVTPVLRSVGVLLALATVATGCDSRRFVTGWAPYWTPATSTATFDQVEPLMEELSPFWYSATADGDIVPKASEASMDEMLATARAAGVPVLPSITDGSGRLVMARLLADRSTRRHHIDAIVDLVVDNGYDGIDLDYEGFAFADGRSSWETTRPVWVRFVRQLGTALHDRGLLLSVTVPPIWNGGTDGYTVYGWAEIAASIDRLRIMTYDWSYGRPGPIGPTWWVQDTLEYALTVVPASKLQIGLPAYGRSWTVATRGTCPDVPGMSSLTLDTVAALITSKRATPVRDEESGEMVFRYRIRVTTPRPRDDQPVDQRAAARLARPTTRSPDSIDGPATPTETAVRVGVCTVTREVWFPDATSWRERALLATDAGAGVAVWALGYETPAEWRALASVGAGLVGPAGTAPTGELGSVRASAEGMTVSGWAFDPEGDLPILVRLTTTDRDDPDAPPIVTTLLARDERPDIESGNPGAGEFHGYTNDITLVPGRYRVCAEAIGRYSAPAVTSLGCRTRTVPAPR